jgi:hypothetical protein
MKLFALVSAAILIALPSEARIGETQAKITDRYGKPVQIYRDVKGRTSYIHHFEGYLIVVQYVEGVSASENYAKLNDAELTESDMDGILAANAAGEKWTKYPKPVTSAEGLVMRAWVTDRTHAIAMHGQSEINDKTYRNAISVSSRPYIEENKRLDERRKLQQQP